MLISEDKFLIKEDSVYDKRYWLRIANACNQKCIFCLDSDNHVGTFPSLEAIYDEIKKAKESGATRLIISGGEASIHPQFIEVIKIANLFNFSKIQTITNGRMFVYPSFAQSAVDEGLTEATFSIHGHTEKLHDMLTATRGSFQQAIQGIENLIATGKCIINIDICINKQNYKYIEDIILLFQSYNIYEFDLLHIIPFGSALPNQKSLFYSYQEASPYLKKAFAYSKQEGYYIWTNRFPPAYMEEYEELIQDPHKFYDEINGRKELYEIFYKTNRLSCYPNHCPYCFIKKYCRKFQYYIQQIKLPDNIDTIETKNLDHNYIDFIDKKPYFTSLITTYTKSTIDTLLTHLHEPLQNIYFKNIGFGYSSIITKDIDRWIHTSLYVYLEIKEGIEEYLESQILLKSNQFRFIILLNKNNNFFIQQNWHKIQPYLSQIMFKVPFYEKGSEAGYEYSNLLETVAFIDSTCSIFNLPICLHKGGRYSSPNILNLDIIQNNGKPDLSSLVENFIETDYVVKSTRCISCSFYDSCKGLSINMVRTMGFKILKPISDNVVVV